MTVPLAAAILLAVLLPEILPQGRLTATAGATIWLAVLALRALLAVIVAIALLSYLPATQLFEAITAWCLDGITPLFTSHRGVSGHGLGEAALLVPGAVLTLSGLWALTALARGARAVAGWLRRSAVGTGPGESLIVDGSDVLVAAAGLRAPRIVISVGALTQFDDAELAVSLEHERGHIVRRHRYLLVTANLLLAFARFIPGSRQAFQRLRFHLERDADEFALRRGGDSLALASAICKAAGSTAAPSTALAHLAGADTASRLRLLLRPHRSASVIARWSSGGLAILVVGGVMAAAGTVPGLASAGIGQLHKPAAIIQCQ